MAKTKKQKIVKEQQQTKPMECIYIKSLDTIERVMVDENTCSCGGYVWDIDGHHECGWCHTKFD